MESISSHSSSTAHLTLSKCRVPRRKWSSIRPGVPHTICPPARSCSICRPMGAPPYTGTIDNPDWALIRAISAATCNASSRVGKSTMACTDFCLGSTIPSANGIPKAAVLPEPVRDWTMMSRPARTNGKVTVCTSMGSTNPMSAKARRISGRRPMSANEGFFSTALSSAAGAAGDVSSALSLACA